jgi:hypothetical protein
VRQRNTEFWHFVASFGYLWSFLASFGTLWHILALTLPGHHMFANKKTIIGTIHNLKHMTKNTQNIKVKLAAIAAMRTALNFFVETDLLQEASYETAGKDE